MVKPRAELRQDYRLPLSIAVSATLNEMAPPSGKIWRSLARDS